MAASLPDLTPTAQATYSGSPDASPLSRRIPAGPATHLEHQTIKITSIKRGAALALGIGFLGAFSYLMVYLVNNWIRLSAFCASLICILGLGGTFLFSAFFFHRFLRLSRKSEDSNAASICAVEVCINNETVLTVRSWWPLRMARSDVERHGIRVAMSSARRWIAENSQPGGKITRVLFSQEAAGDICDRFVCHPMTHCQEHGHHHDQCAVCLDDLESAHESVRMRKCHHTFHKECLSTWVAQSGRLACLLCRSDHTDLVPQSELTKHIVKEEPSINVLTVGIEEGFLADAE